MDIACLTILEARRLATITEFQTMAGWKPITEFDPYGMAPPDGDTPAGPNWREDSDVCRRYRCELVALEDGRMALRDVADDGPLAPFMLGAFPVR